MEIVGYITTVIVLFFVCGGAISVVGSFIQDKKKTTKLAGMAIPESGEGFDIIKRYDVLYGAHSNERLDGIRVVGYVRVDSDASDSVSLRHMRERWLLVELSDGRRAYIQPHSIVSLLESAQN